MEEKIKEYFMKYNDYINDFCNNKISKKRLFAELNILAVEMANFNIPIENRYISWVRDKLVTELLFIEATDEMLKDINVDTLKKYIDMEFKRGH